MSTTRPPLAPGPIQLFATCIVEHVRPGIGLAVVRVLERLGCQVEYPDDQTCCGQPAFNTGARGDARAMARHTVDCLSRSTAPVVVPSGSCADMLVHQYPALLADEPAEAARAIALARRTYEFSEAVSQLEVATEGRGAETRRGRRHGAVAMAYHASCHLLRGLGVVDEPVALIERAQDAPVVPLAGCDECCGFGGLFSIKMSEISAAMLARKIANLEASGASVVAACDASCLLHIEGGLRRRDSSIVVKHLAEVLDEAAR
ncbi:MAG: (Fe-S)-binding protein [Vicinamibacterales bacterium]